MAIPATTAAPPAPSFASEAVPRAYHIAFSGAAGAFAGWVFNIIDPVGGAVFGVASYCASSLGRALTNVLHPNETAAKTTAHFLTFIASLAVGALAVSLAGFEITLMGAVGLSLAMTAVVLSLAIIPVCLMVSSPVANCVDNCSAQPHV